MILGSTHLCNEDEQSAGFADTASAAWFFIFLQVMAAVACHESHVGVTVSGTSNIPSSL